MSTFRQVDPNTFIDQTRRLPADGRGAWTREGIGFAARYEINPTGQPRIGTVCERSLDHWAVAAGVGLGVQQILIAMRLMPAIPDTELGIFGPKTRAAVLAFQKGRRDPDGYAVLEQDGTFGRSDARALYTPLIDRAEIQQAIPDRFVRGQLSHESALDPGAIGFYIYYPVDSDKDGDIDRHEYRGVDRGIEQNNNRYNPDVTWVQAFDPRWSIVDAARRLRTRFNEYTRNYPTRSETVRWEAAICAHNSPARALAWVRNGGPTSLEAAKYVAAVKAARY